jgi:predicted ATP-dependent protease
VQRGLTGEQGVLIPKDNVQHLMLRRDVIEAVEKGQFNVYPVSSVDEAIELLSGIPAGDRDPTGKFTAGSVNERVDTRLRQLAESQIEFELVAKKKVSTRKKSKARKPDAGKKGS